VSSSELLFVVCDNTLHPQLIAADPQAASTITACAVLNSKHQPS
jgi:hypothetical protein